MNKNCSQFHLRRFFLWFKRLKRGDFHSSAKEGDFWLLTVVWSTVSNINTGRKIGNSQYKKYGGIASLWNKIFYDLFNKRIHLIQYTIKAEGKRMLKMEPTIQKICNESLLLKVFEWFPRSIILPMPVWHVWNNEEYAFERNGCSKYYIQPCKNIPSHLPIYANVWVICTEWRKLRFSLWCHKALATNKYFAFD